MPKLRTSCALFGSVPVLLFVAGCSSLNHHHQPTTADPLAQRLDPILHRHDTPGLHFGARVVDLETGTELYAHDIDRPLMPASNMKLPVSAAGLSFFGPNHIFKTYLAMNGDDLWIVGTGDPATGDPTIAKSYKQTTLTMLDEWVEALRYRDIGRVRDIYYYDGAFELEQVHPSWSKSFAGDWYACPTGGLTFNDNCVDITITPTHDSEPVKVSVMPPVHNIKIVNECKTGDKQTADVTREPSANVYRITGAATRPTELPSKSVTDPGAFFADAFRTHLQRKGVRVDGDIRHADHPLGDKLEPPADKLLATHESKMMDVMWRIDKNSQNMFAEAMCKSLGRAWSAKQDRDEPGSWKNGGEAVRDFLDKNGIRTREFVIIDGSGLSRQNRVTVHLISDVLVTLWRGPYREEFRRSLSAAGVDGTLKNRMKDVTGNFFGKTGFIGGVRSLSGYVKTRDGKWLVVSMIYNGIDGSVKPVEDMQDDVVRELIDFPKVKSMPSTAPSVAER